MAPRHAAASLRRTTIKQPSSVHLAVCPQARFFAPGNKQSLVRAIADATPAPIALPDNN